MDDGPFWFALDLACAAVHWEDENRVTADSTELAGSQATEIGLVLDQYKRTLNERG